ncbi:unnamed protein product [Paramecium octaurelia]|uniref:Uncharacterized protein n=1 Tax=Paramecium octaurelia TaxID=43137 RepID=A0A8S1UC43_PAROT|nr:unnamed protein product [Paramecium octaurelia]
MKQQAKQLILRFDQQSQIIQTRASQNSTEGQSFVQKSYCMSVQLSKMNFSDTNQRKNNHPQDDKEESLQQNLQEQILIGRYYNSNPKYSISQVQDIANLDFIEEEDAQYPLKHHHDKYIQLIEFKGVCFLYETRVRRCKIDYFYMQSKMLDPQSC